MSIRSQLQIVQVQVTDQAVSRNKLVVSFVHLHYGADRSLQNGSKDTGPLHRQPLAFLISICILPSSTSTPSDHGVISSTTNGISSSRGSAALASLAAPIAIAYSQLSSSKTGICPKYSFRSSAIFGNLEPPPTIITTFNFDLSKPAG
ncbi:hypothetical protein RvY_11697-2 [Ramazzottius varieornatus]|uniref:Uncharacterized protein n=1 Tax=Ramazzottius varieornatus TaxID=947166 RepID=A0A1D1VJE1_RAMVA|nr:hypothetical protein RvY_11697-2 [Ramazzottius varieornatus]